jgi:hypothetical protein
MTSTSELEAELSSRSKEDSKRWLICGSERGVYREKSPSVERHHPGNSVLSSV